MAKRDLHNVLFPKQRKILTHFGEDLLLAIKRRGFTKKLLCERTGFDLEVPLAKARGFLSSTV